MHSNIYEYLCGKIDNIPHILALCGADKRYIHENASDFEKFRELCHSLVRLSGSSMYRAINCAVSEIFGEDIDITQASSDDLWKRFYGERENEESITPVLTFRTAYTDNLTSVIDISRATDFVMPDRYHVGLARERLACGQTLSDSEKNMLIIQALRESAQQSIKSFCPIVVRADCSAQITCRALQYLKNCNLLTETLILVNRDQLDPEAEKLFEFDEILLGMIVEKCDENFAFSMQAIARTASVGNLIWIVKKEDFSDFCSMTNKLLQKWQADRIAPQNCTLKFEEICKFY